MNRTTIIGNLTSNPEGRAVNTSSGVKNVCNFTVAANRSVQGQKITDFFRVSCWGKRADNAMKYLSKGSKVAVTGPVTARAYMGNDGQPRASLEIQAPEEIEYLGIKRESGDHENGNAAGSGYYPTESEDEEYR